MNTNEFLSKLQEYDSKINALETEKHSFIAENSPIMFEQRKHLLENGRVLFLRKLPFIMEHKDHFLNITNNYVIDMFDIMVKVGKPLGCGYLKHDGITLKNLLKAWDLGFTYNGHPIVEYKYFDGMCTIKYIEDYSYVTIHTKPFLDEKVIKKVTEMSYKIKDYEWDYKRITDILKDEV